MDLQLGNWGFFSSLLTTGFWGPICINRLAQNRLIIGSIYRLYAKYMLPSWGLYICYIIPTTYYRNQKNPLIARISKTSFLTQDLNFCLQFVPILPPNVVVILVTDREFSIPCSIRIPDFNQDTHPPNRKKTHIKYQILL